MAVSSCCMARSLSRVMAASAASASSSSGASGCSTPRQTVGAAGGRGTAHQAQEHIMMRSPATHRIHTNTIASTPACPAAWHERRCCLLTLTRGRPRRLVREDSALNAGARCCCCVCWGGGCWRRCCREGCCTEAAGCLGTVESVEPMADAGGAALAAVALFIEGVAGAEADPAKLPAGFTPGLVVEG